MEKETMVVIPAACRRLPESNYLRWFRLCTVEGQKITRTSQRDEQDERMCGESNMHTATH